MARSDILLSLIQSANRGDMVSFRKAVEAVQMGDDPDLKSLVALTEGQKETQGAFQTKKWR